MNENIPKKIFDTNYTLNPQNKDEHGIDLSLVKHVCELCNAIVYFDSNKDKSHIFI